LRLAGELGLRRAEVAGLSRANLITDVHGHWLRFVGKGDKERTIPLPAGLAVELVALIDSTAGDYAFPGIGGRGHMTPHWMGTLVSRLLPDGYTMHKLRHRAGTEAYRRSGNDIYLASKLLGHASVVTTQAYVAADLSRLRSVVEDIAA
jgi:integrase